jgi:hypothetical protein
MGKYLVKVRVTKVLEKPYTIYADSVEAAEMKAAELVSKWDGIEDAEGFDAEEIE